jgi:hypothetical protein
MTTARVKRLAIVSFRLSNSSSASESCVNPSSESSSFASLGFGSRSASPCCCSSSGSYRRFGRFPEAIKFTGYVSFEDVDIGSIGVDMYRSRQHRSDHSTALGSALQSLGNLEVDGRARRLRVGPEVRPSFQPTLEIGQIDLRHQTVASPSNPGILGREAARPACRATERSQLRKPLGSAA